MGKQILQRTFLLISFLSIFLLCSFSAQGAPLSGTKTIGGAGADYPNLKTALRDLTAQGTIAPGVTFKLRSGAWYEDSLIVQTATTSAAAPVIITVETGANVTIYDSASTALPFVIKIDNTPYVTIDGGTSKALTWYGIGKNAQKGILVSGSSQYTTIKNCVVKAGAYSSSSYSSIELSSATSMPSPHYSKIDNNIVRNSYYGVRLTGNSATDSLLGITVSNNLIDSVAQDGVYTTYTAYTQICGNDISCLIGGTATIYGIYAGSGTDFMRIYNNRIHDLNQTSTSSSTTYGIGTNTGASTHGGINIYNNFVYISPSNNGTGGIYALYSSETNNTIPDTVAYNTAVVTGSSAGVRSSNAYYRGSSVGSAGVVLLNNILQNTRTDAAGSVVCAIGRTSVTSKLVSNNNNLWVGVQDATHKIGRIGTGTSMLVYTSLAEWQAGDTSDAASISEDAPFISATDLHIKKGQTTKLAGAALPIPGVTTDIDNETRSTTKPDIGADEFSNTQIPVELSTFTATASGKIIKLEWTTITEKNNMGFEIERNIAGVWEKVTFIKGKGSTTEISRYEYSDICSSSSSIIYRLKQIDFDGSVNYSKEARVNAGISPVDFSLNQNYPKSV